MNRTNDETPPNAQGPSRRDVLVKAGMSLLVVMAGGFTPNALTVGQGEGAKSSDSQKMTTTNDPTHSAHQREPAPSESDPFWYARDLMGLID